MSVWRQKAIDCLPESRKEFEQPETSIYDVFFTILPVAVEAHKTNDVDLLKKIYAYAEWRFRQKEKDIWNSAGVAFYEHLGDYEETRKAMPQWIGKNLYKEIRGLLEVRISTRELLELDKHYP